MKAMVSYVEHARPLAFIFENVMGFTHTSRQHSLERVLSRCGYTVHSRMLNSRDFNVPQCRNRFYLVGLLRGAAKNPDGFKWPEGTAEPPPLSSVIESSLPLGSPPPSATAQRNILHAGRTLANPNAVVSGTWSVIDVAASANREQVRVNYSPCLTKARAEGRSFMLVNGACVERMRPLTTLECARLQGVSDHEFHERVQFLTDKQHRDALGNAMTVTVVQAFVQSVLPHISE